MPVWTLLLCLEQMATDSHRYINQDSGDTEQYTDLRVLQCARRVMGSIELDVASSPLANKWVEADRFFHVYDNALTKDEWVAKTVWMNHPFKTALSEAFVNMLVSQYRAGNVGEAMGICFASIETNWFQPLLDFPLWFAPKRLGYYSVRRRKWQPSATKASIVYYLPPQDQPGKAMVFKRVFESTLGGRVYAPLTEKGWNHGF